MQIQEGFVQGNAGEQHTLSYKRRHAAFSIYVFEIEFSLQPRGCLYDLTVFFIDSKKETFKIN